MQVDSYIFRTQNVKNLFNNKFVVLIGDSVVRSMYKDLVLILQENRLMEDSELRKRGERSFLGDELIEGGEKTGLTNGKNYREVRQYLCPRHLVRFYFVTRVYNSYMKTILADLVVNHPPDIIIVNSCLWDISRYGSSSMVSYRENLQRFCACMKRLLSDQTLLIWTTTMPVAQFIRGGFLVEQVSFLSDVLRLELLMANYYAHQVVTDHGFDVLDLHYEFRRQTDKRAADGIHWNAIVHRAITNLLLQHVCESWHVAIPNSDFARSTPKDLRSGGDKDKLTSHLMFKRPSDRSVSNIPTNSNTLGFSDDQNIGLCSNQTRMSTPNGDEDHSLTPSYVGSYPNEARRCNSLNFGNFSNPYNYSPGPRSYRSVLSRGNVHFQSLANIAPVAYSGSSSDIVILPDGDGYVSLPATKYRDRIRHCTNMARGGNARYKPY